METRPNGTTYLAAVIAVILWGFSFVWTNILLNNHIEIFTFLFIRLAIAGVLLWIFSKCLKKLQPVKPTDFLWMCLMAFSEPFIYFIGESFGMQAAGSATVAAVIIATIPIFCLIVERIAYQIPFSIYKTLGILLTIPGILMVVFQDGALSVGHMYGIALLFLAVAGAVGYSVVVKKMAARYNNYTIATYQFLIGAVFFLPFFLVYGINGLTPVFFTAKILLPLLTLAVLCSCVAFVLWVSVIGNLGIARANIFSSLIPGVSAIGAFMIGQEELPLIRMAGIAIVIGGVILAQQKKRAS